MDVQHVLDDLVAEQHDLDAIVAALSADQWSLATPSPGWTVTDQIGHLTFFDTTAALAISDPPAFVAHRSRMMASFADGASLDEVTLGDFRRSPTADRLAEWRRCRAALEAAGRTLADDSRVDWYGPSMGARSFLTARLMEVWAHGQDVCDAVGATRPPTDRLRHIAQLGVITRGWSYAVRGATRPDVEVRIVLTAPSGTVWAWGPDDADESVVGAAEDFCLVVTQRRHVDDTDLIATGSAARDWMLKAQAFAGSATTGPTSRRTTPEGGH